MTIYSIEENNKLTLKKDNDNTTNSERKLQNTKQDEMTSHDMIANPDTPDYIPSQSLEDIKRNKEGQAEEMKDERERELRRILGKIKRTKNEILDMKR